MLSDKAVDKALKLAAGGSTSCENLPIINASFAA